MALLNSELRGKLRGISDMTVLVEIGEAYGITDQYFNADDLIDDIIIAIKAEPQNIAAKWQAPKPSIQSLQSDMNHIKSMVAALNSGNLLTPVQIEAIAQELFDKVKADTVAAPLAPVAPVAPAPPPAAAPTTTPPTTGTGRKKSAGSSTSSSSTTAAPAPATSKGSHSSKGHGKGSTSHSSDTMVKSFLKGMGFNRK